MYPQTIPSIADKHIIKIGFNFLNAKTTDIMIVFRKELDPRKNLEGFEMPKVRKTPSLSSLPRND